MQDPVQPYKHSEHLLPPSSLEEAMSVKTPMRVKPDVPKVYWKFALLLMCFFVAFTLGFFGLFSQSFAQALHIDHAFYFILVEHKVALYLVCMTPLLYWLIERKISWLIHWNKTLEFNDRKLARMNHLYRILNEMNHMIHRVNEREELLRECCRLMEMGEDFSLSWIAMKPTNTEAIMPDMIITSQQESEYLDELFTGLEKLAHEDKSEPAIVALRKKFHFVVNNVKTFSKKEYFWQKLALKYGYCSIAAVPLKITPQVDGVLAVYSSHMDYFRPEELNLLYEVGAVLSTGLQLIEKSKNYFYLANFDMSTNLPNLNLFEERISQAIACSYHEKRHIAIVIVDLLGYQDVVSSHVQGAGDKLFKEVGKRFTQMLSEGDTVARIGYNLVGIMLVNIHDSHDVQAMMQRLLKPFLVNIDNQHEVNVTMVAGVSIYPQDGENASMLLHRAKAALKGLTIEGHENCAFYSKCISSDAKYSQKIEQELAGALSRDEFVVYYQPIVKLPSQLVVGVEALVRWHNPQLGEVPPMQLIPVAEQNGLMMPLGEWILETSCEHMQEWVASQTSTEPHTLSINVSLKQLLYPSFIKHLQAVLDKIDYRSRPFTVAIEIQESAFLNDYDHIKDKILMVRNMGVQIYVDDFGTGYASLSHLSQLPVDALKIDPIFIRGLGKDQNAESLIRGIITLANGLGLNTIAEGVETEKQLFILQQLGCTTVQGYYFSAPMAAKNIETILGKKL